LTWLPSVTVKTVAPAAVVVVTTADVVVAGVVVEVVVPHDANSIAAANNKLKPDQINFLFIFPPFYINTQFNF
jgi:hypothetical protein